MEPFAISGISFMPEMWKEKANLKTLLGHIDEAAEQGAQVIASCEGVLDGYITKELPKHRIQPGSEGTSGYKQRLEKFRKRHGQSPWAARASSSSTHMECGGRARTNASFASEHTKTVSICFSAIPTKPSSALPRAESSHRLAVGKTSSSGQSTRARLSAKDCLEAARWRRPTAYSVTPRPTHR